MEYCSKQEDYLNINVPLKNLETFIESPRKKSIEMVEFCYTIQSFIMASSDITSQEHLKVDNMRQTYSLLIGSSIRTDRSKAF